MRGVTHEKKDSDAKRGNDSMEELIQYIIKRNGGTFTISSPAVDMFDHIDFTYTISSGQQITVDFKAIKYITRLADDDADDDAYNILELTAVNGASGWVYGKADFICFETLDSWLWVPTAKLREFIEENVTDEEPEVSGRLIYTPENYLRKFQRINRKDVIVMVKKEELIKLSTSITKKPLYE